MANNKLSQSPRYKSFMLKLAVFSAILTVVGLVLKWAGVPFNFTLLIVGFSTLAFVALFLHKIFPYRASDNNPRLAPIWNFAMCLSGFALAVLFLRVLFVLLHWPGGKVMLITSLIAMVGCGVGWLFYLIQRNKQ